MINQLIYLQNKVTNWKTERKVLINFKLIYGSHNVENNISLDFWNLLFSLHDCISITISEDSCLISILLPYSNENELKDNYFTEQISNIKTWAIKNLPNNCDIQLIDKPIIKNLSEMVNVENEFYLIVDKLNINNNFNRTFAALMEFEKLKIKITSYKFQNGQNRFFLSFNIQKQLNVNNIKDEMKLLDDFINFIKLNPAISGSIKLINSKNKIDYKKYIGIFGNGIDRNIVEMVLPAINSFIGKTKDKNNSIRIFPWLGLHDNKFKQAKSENIDIIPKRKSNLNSNDYDFEENLKIQLEKYKELLKQKGIDDLHIDYQKKNIYTNYKSIKIEFNIIQTQENQMSKKTNEFLSNGILQLKIHDFVIGE